MKKFLILTLSAMLLLAGGYTAGGQDLFRAFRLLQGAAKAAQAFTLTDDALAESMRENMNTLDDENDVCPAGSPYAQRLDRITQGLTQIDGIPLNFKVYVSDDANAFASPDGSVRVYSKLMDIMTDREILGVLAHELGHLEARHPLKQYRTALLVSAARDGLQLSDGTIGALAASSLGDLSEVLLNAKYSRDQEREADRYGFQYLLENGNDPSALADALRKLLSIQNDPNAQYLRNIVHLFSTHPDLEERIAALEEMEM